MNKKITGSAVKSMASMSVLAIAMTTSTAVYAQSDEAAESRKDDNTIIVTARRREEVLQDVPISISVKSAEELTKEGVNDVSDLDTNLANVSIGTSIGRGGNAGVISIRGIGEVSSDVNRDPGVGLYIDDIYFGRADGSFMTLVDVQRVEVLRGPQGTLFGKNTTGGAVRIVSENPNFRGFQAEAEATYGRFNRTDFRAMVNVPLGDSLAFRLTGAYQDRDGWFLREIDGVKVDDSTFKGIRGQLRWEPSDRLNINLSGFYLDSSNNGGAVKLVGTTAASGGPATLRVVAYNRERPAGAPQYGNGAFVTSDPDSTFGGTLETYSFDGVFLSAVAEYNITDDIAAKAIFGYNNNNVMQVNDRDISPADVYIQFIDQKLQGESAELQLLGSTDNLEWVAGLYYFHENPIEKRIFQDYSEVNDPPNPSSVGNSTDQDTKSYAAFAQATLTLTDWIDVTAGLRYTKEDKRLVSSQFDARTGPVMNVDPALPLVMTASNSFSDFSPMGNIAVKPTEDILIYGTVSKGFRSGGINDNIDTRLPNNGIFGFEPETLTSYEVGLKTQWFDRHLTLNAAAFTSDYKDLQVTLVDPVTSGRYFANAAKARIKGVELEGNLIIVPGLKILGSLGLLDAKYTELDIAASVANTLSLDSKFARAPKTSYSVGVRFDQPVADAGDLSFSANYGWKSAQESTAQNITSITIPSYGLVNGRVQFTSASERWSAAIFCTNCLDKRYIRGGVDFSGRGAFGSITNDVGRPFEMGITLGLEY